MEQKKPNKNTQENKKNSHSKKTEIWSEETSNGVRRLKSCGIILFTKDRKEFLLMKHASRYDLPKGHKEKGETDIETALREFQEETSLDPQNISVDPNFKYEVTYFPNYKRFGYQQVEKVLNIFLAHWNVDANPKIITTEHQGFQWLPWNPPHSIQQNTIDPMLQQLEKHFKSTDLNMTKTSEVLS